MSMENDPFVWLLIISSVWCLQIALRQWEVLIFLQHSKENAKHLIKHLDFLWGYNFDPFQYHSSDSMALCLSSSLASLESSSSVTSQMNKWMNNKSHCFLQIYSTWLKSEHTFELAAEWQQSSSLSMNSDGRL